MPVNVLYMVRTWGIGGTHTLMRLLLRNLSEKGFRMMVAGYAPSNPVDEEFFEILRREGHEVLPERVPWNGPPSWLSARRAVAGLAAKYDIRIIHTHDNLSNLIVAYTNTRQPCARVASAYGWFEPKSNVQVVSGAGWFDGWSRRKLLLYYWIDLNLALPRFDVVYTVSHTMKRKLLTGRTAAQRICVVYTGIEADKFDQGSRRNEVRRHFRLPEDSIVVGTVSRLSGEKGHIVLLDAVQRLAKDLPELRLLIVGRGYMREQIERRAKDLGIAGRVVLAGYYEDLPGALASMDIFALPSLLDEGLPTSVLEAQAAGLPVVASDAGGTCESIAPDLTGLLVPPGDASALGDALAALAKNKQLRLEMGMRARERVRQCFTVARMMSEIAAAYRQSMLKTR